jgi:hypothetical protein
VVDPVELGGGQQPCLGHSAGQRVAWRWLTSIGRNLGTEAQFEVKAQVIGSEFGVDGARHVPGLSQGSGLRHLVFVHCSTRHHE